MGEGGGAAHILAPDRWERQKDARAGLAHQPRQRVEDLRRRGWCGRTRRALARALRGRNASAGAGVGGVAADLAAEGRVRDQTYAGSFQWAEEGARDELRARACRHEDEQCAAAGQVRKVGNDGGFEKLVEAILEPPVQGIPKDRASQARSQGSEALAINNLHFKMQGLFKNFFIRQSMAVLRSVRSPLKQC